MWKVALGIAVFLQVGGARAEQGNSSQSDESAVHVDCPAGSEAEDCTADPAAAVPEVPPVTPAAAAAVAAVPPPVHTAFATVSFRNDVGKKLRLVEARFTMD